MPFNIRGKTLAMIAVLGAGLIWMTPVKAQEQSQIQGIAQENVTESTNKGKEISDWTRIAISTSGPAQFDSHWREDQLKLVIEFRSRNILSQVDEEIIVNSGVIKRITSSYWGKGDVKALKTLNFELSENVPYKIWQEDNTIFIAFPMSSLKMGKEGMEEQKATEPNIQRLEVMDNALAQISWNQQSTQRNEQPSNMPLSTKILKEPVVESDLIPSIQEVRGKKQAEKKGSFPREGKRLIGIVMGWVGMTFFLGAGFWGIRRQRKNFEKKINKLTSELDKQGILLRQEEMIRKAIEETSLVKEKEFEQLKSSFAVLKLQSHQKDEILRQKEDLFKETNQALLQKQKDYEQLKDSFDDLQELLVKKEDEEKASSMKGKEEPQIAGKSSERRAGHRLFLTKDFHKTIILRIKSSGQSQSIKSFADNISGGGLSFEAKSEFKESDRMNLKLFFYGDRVPIIKIQGRILWKRTEGSNYRYGVCFESVKDADKSELNRYLGSKKEVVEDALSLVS